MSKSYDLDLAEFIYRLGRENAIQNIISTIDLELQKSNSAEYACLDGTIIHTDVGYVSDWFCEYKEKLKEILNMKINEYQKLAARTINQELKPSDQGKHALHGMVGEIGELHSIYQKRYQGHEFDEEHAKKELGDLLWFIAEYCTAHDWSLDEIMQMNIDKLKARFPEGFSADKSLHRKENDI